MLWGQQRRALHKFSASCVRRAFCALLSGPSATLSRRHTALTSSRSCSEQTLARCNWQALALSLSFSCTTKAKDNARAKKDRCTQQIEAVSALGTDFRVYISRRSARLLAASRQPVDSCAARAPNKRASKELRTLCLQQNHQLRSSSNVALTLLEQN